jgi:hypothetical protein
VRVALLAVGLWLIAAPAFAQLPFSIPDFCDTPDITATTNNFTALGASAGDKIVIPSGVTVTYNQNSATAYKAICIESGGLLTFGTSGTLRLVVSELVVEDGGELRIGTVASPFTGTATIEFSGTLDDGDPDDDGDEDSQGTDPEQFGVGLIVAGTINVHGVAKTPYVRLAANANSGATTLTLANVPAVGTWASGDEIYIPESEQRSLNGSGSDANAWAEYNQTAGVTKKRDRRTLTANVTTTTASLNSALTYNHPGALDRDGNYDYYPHALNLTRNIVFKSANPSGVRGHSIYMHGALVDIRYAAYEDMGRTSALIDLHCTLFTTGAAQYDDNCTPGTGAETQIGTNQKGRYAVHFHHLHGAPDSMDTDFTRAAIIANPGATFIGNAIVDATKWPVTLHNTSFMLIQQNIAADYEGPGYFGEDGNEHYNVFDGNFAAGGYGVYSPRHGSFRGTASAGLEGAGFWFTGGTNNYFTNNIAAGMWTTSQQIVADVGFKFFHTPSLMTVKIPSYRGAYVETGGQYTTADSRVLPLLQFEDNEAYGMMTGMTIWQSGTDGFTDLGAGVSTVQDLVVWAVSEEGFFAYSLANYVFDGLTIRGDPAKVVSTTSPVGLADGDYKFRDITVRNATVENVAVAMLGEGGAHGSGVDGAFVYENSTSKAAIGIQIGAFYTPGAAHHPIEDRTITIRNVVHTTLGAAALRPIWLDYHAQSLAQAHCTVAASPTPTTTVMTVENCTYDGGAWTAPTANVLIQSRGANLPYEVNYVQSVAGNQITLTSALDYAPSAGADVRWAGYWFGDDLNETITVEDYQGTTADFRIYREEQIGADVAGGPAPCSDQSSYPEIEDGVTCDITGVSASRKPRRVPTLRRIR